MGRYPRTVAYLRKLQREGKLKEFYDFEFLEQFVHKKSVEEFQIWSSSLHKRLTYPPESYKLLFSAWINDQHWLREENIYVYRGVFSKGQHIQAFRDYFGEYVEEETENSKGMVIEFKAYGQSMKINRKVIAFEGRFVNDLLVSYTDRTSSSDDYTSSRNEYRRLNVFVLPKDFFLLSLLRAENCADLLSPSEIIAIERAEAERLAQDRAIALAEAERRAAALAEAERLDKERALAAAQLAAEKAERVAKERAEAEAERLEKMAAWNRKERLKKIRNWAFWLGIIGFAALYFYGKNNMTKERADSGVPDVTNRNTSIVKGPGKYYVSEKAVDGIVLYKDTSRVSKLPVRLKAMEPVQIAKVMDSLGFFETFSDNDYITIPRGWLEMRYLEPEEGFLLSVLGEPYRIRVGLKKIPVYKDCLKKVKMKSTLTAMDRVDIYKISEDMGYFKGLPNNLSVRGWVEMKNIEKR